MQSSTSSTSTHSDIFTTMQPQSAQNMIMTSNKKKKYAQQTPPQPPKQKQKNVQQFQNTKSFNNVPILKTPTLTVQQHRKPVSQILNRPISHVICTGNVITGGQISSDINSTNFFSLNHRGVHCNNNTIETSGNLSSGFISSSPDINSGGSGGSNSNGSLISLTNNSSHIGNAIGLKVGASGNTYSHEKSITGLNVGCIDNKITDLKNNKLLTNNNFQPTQEYVPSSGTNNTGNIRTNQQTGGLYRGPPSASPAPRNGARHVTMYPQALHQGVVVPTFTQFTSRQPPYPTQPYQFQQPIQSFNFSYPSYYPVQQPQTHSRGAVGVGTGVGVGSGMQVQTGPNGPLNPPPGSSQAQIPITGMLTGTMPTATGAVLSVTNSSQQHVGVPPIVGVVPGAVSSPPNQTNRRRKHALEIIDPTTNKNILEDLDLSKNTSNSETEFVESSNSTSVLPSDIHMNVVQSDHSTLNIGNVVVMTDARSNMPYTMDIQQLPQQRDILVSQTPVVSAISDAPSVEILPTPQKVKNRKILPIIPPKDDINESNRSGDLNENSKQHLYQLQTNLEPAKVSSNKNFQNIEEPQIHNGSLKLDTATPTLVDASNDNILNNLDASSVVEETVENLHPSEIDKDLNENKAENIIIKGDQKQAPKDMQLNESEIIHKDLNDVLQLLDTSSSLNDPNNVVTDETKCDAENNEILISKSENVKEYDENIRNHDDISSTPESSPVICDETDKGLHIQSQIDKIEHSSNFDSSKRHINSTQIISENEIIICNDLNPSTNETMSTEGIMNDNDNGKSPLLEVESLICYNEGQWSPNNPTGKKQYNRTQLLQLREAKASQVQPDVNNSAILPQQMFLMPLFARNNKRVQSMVGSISNNRGGDSIGGNYINKQGSISGVHGRNSMKGMIHVNLSLNQDVKLNETDNAWRPRVLVKSGENDNNPEARAEREKDDLVRKVRGILNKLTPEKFDTLVEEILKLKIDSIDKMEEVMVLVFEKAIDEPNFSVSYARLCHRLITEVKNRDERMESGTKSNLAHFRNALLDKTEREFTQNVTQTDAKEKKLQPLIEKLKKCTDPIEKAELKAQLEEEERKIRRRSGGTVRFIGELFKISMLTGKIIYSCIDNLLNPNSEDMLECLCKLLTTVGAKFEQTSINSKDSTRCYSLEKIMTRMQAIASKTEKDGAKISSRVRFMLQDVIDLRKNKWQSTRNEAPKTMEQIEKETKTEQMSSQYLNYTGSVVTSTVANANVSIGISNKRDDRNNRFNESRSSGVYGGSHSQRGESGSMRRQQQSGNGNNIASNSNSNNDDNTWHVQTSKSSRSLAVDTNKLEGLSQNLDIGTKKMGGLSQFIWNNNTLRQSAASTPAPSNSFAALSSLVDSNRAGNDRDRCGPRNKGSYNKGSIERDKYGDRNMNSRNASSQASRENSSSRNPQTTRNMVNLSSTQKLASHSKYTQPMPSSKVQTKTNSLYSQRSESQSLTQNISEITSSASVVEFVEPSDSDLKIIKSVVSEMIENATNTKTINSSTVTCFSKIKDDQRCGFLYYILTEHLHLRDVGQIQRRFLANIVAYLLKLHLLSIEHFRLSYEHFCELASDLIVDIPDLWLYIFEFTGPLIAKEIIVINDLWINQLKDDSSYHLGSKFLKTYLMYCIREIGPCFTKNMWKKFNMKWSSFIPDIDVENFIKTNKFDFIENDAPYPEIEVNESKEKLIGRVVEHIESLLREGSSADCLIDYINGNIKDISKQFIKSLTTTLCNFAIIYKDESYKLETSCFQKICIPILQRYIDSNEERELECLYSMQLLVHSFEHPRGLLNELFLELYDADIIPQDSFTKWRDSKDQSAGKGVAVKGLNPFFNHLLNNETSDENN